MSDAPPSCVSTTFDKTMPTKAAHVTTPPLVDGDLAEWPCFVSLAPSNVGRVRGTTPDTARFAVAWDSSGVYYAIHVVDATVGGSGSEAYENDAAEIFLAKSAGLDGGALADPIQVSVDYAGQTDTYRMNILGPAPPPPGILTKAQKVTGGYVVEMFVPKDAFGVATMQPGSLGFDLQIDDNAGSTQTGVLYGYYASGKDCGSCPCPTGGDNEPYCNGQLWGALVLEP